MPISRLQIPQQVDVFATGGVSTTGVNNSMSDLGKLLMERFQPPNYQENIQKYQQRLAPYMYQAPRMNIYDLASELGAGLLSTPNTGGASAFTGLGVGFTRVSDRLRHQEEQNAKARQQIGFQAAQLAMQDERKANEFLNKALFELAKTDTDNDIKSYFITGDKPLTLNGKVHLPGTQLNLTKAEAYKHRDNITGGGPGGIKVPGSGTQGMYMSKEDAEETIKNLGLSKNMESFDEAVESITAPSDAQIGTPIILAGQYVELTPLVKDGVVYNVLRNGVKGVTPPYIIARDARLKAIQKSKDKYADNLTNVLPTVDRAMNQIMAGAETGPLTDLTINFKAGINQIFGISDPAVNTIQDIRGISFFLAPKMRPVGSGSTSDMEFKAYQNAILSLEKGAFANYISLYAFDKMTRNSIRLNQKEEELLQDPTVTSQKTVNDKLKELDLGVFEQLPENIDKDDEQAVTNWYKSLPLGTVIDNSGRIFDDPSPFVIVGWEARPKL